MHSQIPPGWGFGLDEDGHVCVRRTAPPQTSEEHEYSLGAELAFMAVTTVALAALVALVLSCYGIPLKDIPALLGIPT